MSTKRSSFEPPQIEKLLYRRQEAAFALGMSLRAIDYMIASKRLSTRRFGRRVLIPAADVKRVAAMILRGDMLAGVEGEPR